MNETYITFVVYLILMIGVGLYFYRRSQNLEEYLLGGRGLGSWVTALSAQASDMSGWLLMGLPGAVYMLGLSQIWIAIGLLIGTILNWLIVAPRLRVFTEKTNSLTLSHFIGKRFDDKSNFIRILSALMTLFFFIVYAAAGLNATGKLFESMFDMNYTLAVIIGSAVMIFYTLLGGFWAVCWTDLFQGILMFVAIILLPSIAFYQFEPNDFNIACEARNISMSIFPATNSNFYMVILGIVSTMAWGLGYFGQPHILVRFMSIKSVKLLPKSTIIAIIWVVISLGCAIAIGLLSIPMFNDLSASDSEKVFIFMIGKLFSPYIGGILLAAILAAIMSTIDSQLLTSSSTLTEDVYLTFIRPKASQTEQMIASRSCVILTAVVSTIIALNPSKTIFDLVTFAWGGMGAVLGPAILCALFSKRTSWQAIFAGMVVAIITLVLWLQVELNVYMYEIVPGFIANLATIFIINYFIKPTEKAKETFEDSLKKFNEEF